MALQSPSNIAEVSNTDTSFRFTFRSTLSANARLYLLLTPKVYKEFTVEIDAAQVTSGNNQNNDVTLMWSNSIFDDVMRGISYDLSIGLQTTSDRSPYVDAGITLSRPFFATDMDDASAPGFSIANISIPANRVSDSVFSTGELEYIGTWHTYPRIVLTGKFNYCKIVNTGSGAQIAMTSEVAADTLRVLDTNPLSTQYGLWGGDDEDSLIDYSDELEREANIRDFIIPASNILRRPMAIEAYFYNRDSNTQLDVSYPVRYFELGDNPE